MSCYVIVLWMFAVCLFMHVLSTITNKDRLNGFFFIWCEFQRKSPNNLCQINEFYFVTGVLNSLTPLEIK